MSRFFRSIVLSALFAAVLAQDGATNSTSAEAGNALFLLPQDPNSRVECAGNHCADIVRDFCVRAVDQ